MGKNYDYIVIGSGFGGSISSMCLSEKSYSVLTIEKGRRFRTEDFIYNDLSPDLRSHTQVNPVKLN